MTESIILKTKLQKKSSLPKYYLFNSTKTASLISKHDTSLRWRGLCNIIIIINIYVYIYQVDNSNWQLIMMTYIDFDKVVDHHKSTLISGQWDTKTEHGNSINRRTNHADPSSQSVLKQINIKCAMMITLLYRR
jgi:hypothetical protein